MVWLGELSYERPASEHMPLFPVASGFFPMVPGLNLLGIHVAKIVEVTWH